MDANEDYLSYQTFWLLLSRFRLAALWPIEWFIESPFHSAQCSKFWTRHSGANIEQSALSSQEWRISIQHAALDTGSSAFSISITFFPFKILTHPQTIISTISVISIFHFSCFLFDSSFFNSVMLMLLIFL
jgi:hypothetical protein